MINLIWWTQLRGQNYRFISETVRVLALCWRFGLMQGRWNETMKSTTFGAKMLTTIIFQILLMPIIFLLIAGGLILSQRPKVLPHFQNNLDFSGIPETRSVDVPDPKKLKMRDGYMLSVRIYGEAGRGPLLILVHGSGWHGLQFDTLARALSDKAYVVVPDLRGHGEAPERRGDVDHIGQYEEDLADLINGLRQNEEKVVVVGHSSGGGLVIRMAGGPYSDRIDRVVLLAPFLKYNAPTMRPNSGGWAHPLSRRLIGLSMLNTIGIRMFNNLQVIQFAMPQTVLDGPLGHTATTSYTYRLNTGFSPRTNYRTDISMLPPFLFIVGRDDESFIAEEFEPVLSSASDQGSYHIVDGVGHLDIMNRPETIKLIRDFLQAQ
jgi:pimeloyl-ACP methyl ester carboxylesterase